MCQVYSDKCFRKIVVTFKSRVMHCDLQWLIETTFNYLKAFYCTVPLIPNLTEIHIYCFYVSLRGISTYIMDLFGKDDEEASLSLSEIGLKHVKVNSKGSKHFQ